MPPLFSRLSAKALATLTTTVAVSFGLTCITSPSSSPLTLYAEEPRRKHLTIKKSPTIPPPPLAPAAGSDPTAASPPAAGGKAHPSESSAANPLPPDFVIPGSTISTPKDREGGTVIITSNVPFSEGKFRYAFRAKFRTKSGVEEEIVVKSVKKKYLQIYEDEEKHSMAAQNKAMELAEHYNQHRNKRQRRARITFLPVWLYKFPRQVKNEKGQVLIEKDQTVSIEPYIEGNYEKFSSNTGWVTQELLTPGAFGHFTWHTTHELVVCDLQGTHVWSTDTKEGHFLLTDPAICSISQEYGMSDLGEQGIAAFFKHHTCGHMCKGFMTDRPAFKYKRWPKKQDTTDEQTPMDNTPEPKVEVHPIGKPEKPTAGQKY